MGITEENVCKQTSFGQIFCTYGSTTMKQLFWKNREFMISELYKNSL